MANKSFSVFSVVKYGFHPFLKGFTAATLGLGILFAACTFLGECYGFFMQKQVLRLLAFKPILPAGLFASKITSLILYGTGGLLVVLFLCSLLFLVAMRLALSVCAGRQFTLAFASVMPSLGVWVRFCGISVLLLCMVMLGMVAFIIPGLLVLARFGLSQYYVIEGAGVLEALKKSWYATQGYFWKILGVFGIFLLMRSIGEFFLSALVALVIPIWLFIVMRFLFVAFFFGVPMVLAQAKIYRILSA